TMGGPYTTLLGTSITQATGPLTMATYYVVDVTCTNPGGSTVTTSEKSVLVNPLPPVMVSPLSGSFCTPGGSAVTLTASGASTYTWSPTLGLTPTTGAVVSASPSTTTTYVVTGTDGNGCVNTASSTISVAISPQNVMALATPPAICIGTSSNLTSSAYVPTSTTANNYQFTSGTGATLDPMSGATMVLAAGDDDTPTATPVAIGFSFNYDGVNYSQYSVSPDGWLLLGGATAVSQFTNAVTSNINVPKIYPLWDDQSTGLNGSVKVLVTGSPGNRIFKVQWQTVLPRTGTHATTPFNSTYQVWLYETTNIIEFRYGSMGVPGLTNSGAAGGLTGAVSTNFNSITFSTNTSSSAVANDANQVAPPSGQIYTFKTPSAALSYSWSPVVDVVSPGSQNTATNNLAVTTIFTVTVTNAGCSSTASTTVTVDPLTCSPATVSATHCANTNFTVTANLSGGGAPFNYSWDDGIGGVYPNAQMITANLPAGMYTFTATVTDNCGSMCTSSVDVTVNGLPSVMVSPTTGLICNPGGSPVILTAGGASTYTWSPTTGLTPTSGSPVSANPTVSTIYTVTGTDANGCMNTASSSITVGPVVSISAVTATPNPICQGGNSILTVSFPALVYCASTHSSGCSGDNITNVSLGSISNPTTGCGGASHYTYFNPSTPTTTTTLSNAGSPYSLAVSFGTDGNQYFGAWIDYNQDGTFATNEFLGASANAGANGTTSVSFTVPGTALNGITRLRIVGGNDNPVTSTQACGVSSSAFGETQDYDVTIIGVVPFTYLWSPNTFLSSTVTNPTTASAVTVTTPYSVTVTSADGCSATGAVTLNVNILTLTTSSTQANCPLQNDGTATVMVSGGSSPYMYLWSSGATVATATGLTAGTYTVTVTDNIGCTATSTAIVTNNPAGPVHNINTGLNYCTIQSAINAPLTLNGHKIVIDAGTYTENVTVTKELELQGAGQGLTIVRPAISNPTGGSLGSVIFKVQANNVLIHDLTANGKNPLITGASDVDASTGIINDWSTGDWTNMVVHHVTVQDVYSRGLEAANDVNATNTFNFHHNTIDGVQGDATSIAILNYGEAGPINDNTITNSNGGIFTNYGFGSNISNNSITNPAGATGIESDNNGGAGGGSVADIIAFNTVTGGAYGVYIYQPFLVSNIHDNTITGASTGIYVNGGPGSANIHDNNATISGSVIGIDVDAASATITNNSIYNNGIGVRFTNGGNGTVNNLNNFDGGINPDNGRDIQLTSTAGTVLASPNNNLAGDIFGVENLTTVNVDATLNFWESPTGPGPIGPGIGANVTTKVLFCPWLNAPAPGGTPVSTVASIAVTETSGFVNNDGIICSGASVTLAASPAGGTYLWAPGGQTTSSITVSPAMTTLYTVTVSYPGCDNVATRNIIVNPSPNATITSNASIYQGSSGNIASVPSGGAGTTYLWSLSSGMITAGAGTNTITYKAGTPPSMNINVTVTSTNGCSASSSNVVAVLVPASATMTWEPDNITPTSCGPSTNCCLDTLCFNLKYTPGVTGFLTTYTTGFFINCLGSTSPVGYNKSCVMTNNSFQISQCALIDSVLFNSSGNNGGITVPVTQGAPIILHRVCINISTGESVQIREDNVTNLSASVDQIGSGHLTEFPTYTTQTFSKPAPIIPANVIVTINCPADTLFPVPPPVVDFCGNNVPATLTSRVSTPSSLSCEGTKVYNFNYIDCSGYTQPWSYTYIVEYLDFTIATPPGGSIVACPALSNVV
ncbi:MAG: GEVED domain-containing protein, partial [Saprospiraceae bacterium]